MAKKAAPKKTKAAPKATPVPKNPDTTPESTVSKAEAVRQAIAADVKKPAEGVAYVLEHFGIEMDNKTFSLYRSQQKIRDAKQATGTPKGKPGRKPKSVDGSTSVRTGNTNLLSAMEAMKPLVESLGKDQVKRIVDLIG